MLEMKDLNLESQTDLVSVLNLVLLAAQRNLWRFWTFSRTGLNVKIVWSLNWATLILFQQFPAANWGSAPWNVQQRVKEQEWLIRIAKIFIVLLVFSEPHLQHLSWSVRRQGATGRETANHSYSQCDQTAWRMGVGATTYIRCIKDLLVRGKKKERVILVSPPPNLAQPLCSLASSAALEAQASCFTRSSVLENIPFLTQQHCQRLLKACICWLQWQFLLSFPSPISMVMHEQKRTQLDFQLQSYFYEAGC